MVVAETVGVAVEGDDHAAVEDPVEQGGGDGGVAEDLAPGADGPVGGDDDRGFQVALGDDLEQRGGGFGGQRQVAQLVDLCRCRATPATQQADRTAGGWRWMIGREYLQLGSVGAWCRLVQDPRASPIAATSGHYARAQPSRGRVTLRLLQTACRSGTSTLEGCVLGLEPHLLAW